MAVPYDRLHRWLEPRFLRGTRPWLTSRTTGRVLEVAVGTGLTLPHYPAEADLVGLDASRRMLRVARRRADALGREMELRHGDAHDLPWPDSSFDAVVCVFGLCAVADPHRAVGEMGRVLRPGGLLLLADHVPSTRRSLLAVQTAMDAVSVPLAGEHWRRRQLPLVEAMGFAVEAHDRFLHGVVERVAARRPVAGRQPGTPLG
ncbi:MAG: class I SAM-dependent methyltransferase [Kineosporiaceae bacterium]